MSASQNPSGEQNSAADHEESSTSRIIQRVGGLLVLPLIGLIRLYQLVISPLTPPTCRYYPSCSAYALTALRRYGPVKGTWLAIRRLSRCHPWTPGGVDYVPERAPRSVPHTAMPRDTAKPPAAGSSPFSGSSTAGAAAPDPAPSGSSSPGSSPSPHRSAELPTHPPH